MMCKIRIELAIMVITTNTDIEQLLKEQTTSTFLYLSIPSITDKSWTEVLNFTTSNPPIIKERRPYRKRKITEILPTTSPTTAEPSKEARLKQHNREWYRRNCIQLQPAKQTTTSTLTVPVPHQSPPEEFIQSTNL